MKKSTFMIVLGTAFACAVLQNRPAAAQLKTQTVDYKQADTALEGYLAYDVNFTGKRPGVLLVHRRDGMTDFTRKHADMIAKLGYVVFAADIFGKGVLPKDIPEMQVETAKYNKDRLLMRARAQAGLDTLRQNSLVDPSSVAVIGYCFGGVVAMDLSHTGARLSSGRLSSTALSGDSRQGLRRTSRAASSSCTALKTRPPRSRRWIS